MTDGVSRETPPPPAMAAGVFSSSLATAEQYARILATDGVLRGLIGPREVPRLWERHLVNCALLERAIPANMDVCDIGSGAGLPGVVLAICRPDLAVTLVEPLLRRTTFLDEVVAELQLENVEVVRARAEELHGLREFSVVTSRAVAPLPRLLDWSMPLVRQGGFLLAVKGSTAHQEVEGATAALARHGAGKVRVLSLGDGLIDQPTTAIRVESTRPSRLGLGEKSQAVTRDARKKRRRKRGKGR